LGKTSSAMPVHDWTWGSSQIWEGNFLSGESEKPRKTSGAWFSCTPKNRDLGWGGEANPSKKRKTAI